MSDQSATAPQSGLAKALDSDFVYSFRRSPVAVVSFVVVMLLVLSAVFAPLIAPYDPFDPGSLDLMNGFTAPMAPNDFTGDVFGLAQMTRAATCSPPFSTGCACRSLLVWPL